MATALEPKRRRSWLVPRFSLRTALLALTAFGIGFPIWYRWPYEEVEQITSGYERVTSWRRQWGGGRTKHGPERIMSDGQPYRLVSYKNGMKDGPYADYEIQHGFDFKSWTRKKSSKATSKPWRTGQFLEGKRHGTWTEIIEGKNVVAVYDHGEVIDIK